MIERNWREIAKEFLREWEGFRDHAYQDVGGIWTIGYGRTGQDVGPSSTTTREAEEIWLEQRVEQEAVAIFQLFDLPAWMGNAQIAALICLRYNIGSLAFRNSRVYQVLRSPEWQRPQVEREWKGWHHVKGQDCGGLKNRRQAELDLFFGK